MANGDRIDSAPLVYSGIPGWYVAYRLLDAVTANDNGAWVDVRGTESLTVDVTLGGGAGSIQLMGSNAPTKPANSTDGRNLGAAIVADGLVSVTEPVRWIKAKLTGYGSGTISAWLQGL